MILKMGTPISIETSIRVQASREEVWKRLVDWERLQLWMLEASDFKVTSSHREGVGVTAVATIRIAGIRTTDPVEVVGWEPPTKLEIEHQGWVKGTGLMTCATNEDGSTRVDWRESLDPPLGALGRLGLMMLRRRMRSIFQRDLEMLKNLVEGGEATLKRTKQPSALFIRWFWLVYLPLGLLAAGVLLVVFGVLPANMKWPLLLLAAYGLLAIRLLIERKRKGLSVPPPRNIVIGILSVAGLLVLGAILFVLGMGRLTTTEGLVLAGVGGFLMILSVTVPTFRMVDAALRWSSKMISRRTSG